MMPLGESIKGETYIKNEETREYKRLESFKSFGKSAVEVVYSFEKFANAIANVTVHFEIKHITRKRFVKLLMGNGYQRNEANQIARRVWFKNGHYTYFDLLTLGL